MHWRYMQNARSCEHARERHFSPFRRVSTENITDECTRFDDNKKQCEDLKGKTTCVVFVKVSFSISLVTRNIVYPRIGYGLPVLLDPCLCRRVCTLVRDNLSLLSRDPFWSDVCTLVVRTCPLEVFQVLLEVMMKDNLDEHICHKHSAKVVQAMADRCERDEPLDEASHVVTRQVGNKRRYS